jgi:hypothetical protein
MHRRLDHAEEPEYETMRPLLKFGLCVLAATVPALASAEKFGRLFFTPEQREQLDYNYAQGAPSENYNNALMLNGIVQKHGGKRTVWVNGVQQSVGSSDEKSPEIATVPLPGQNKSVKLKVGQRVLLGPSANQEPTQPETPKN